MERSEFVGRRDAAALLGVGLDAFERIARLNGLVAYGDLVDRRRRWFRRQDVERIAEPVPIGRRAGRTRSAATVDAA